MPIRSWLFLLDGADDARLRAAAARAAGRSGDARSYWKSGLIGGALSLVAYWIAIWAMTVAPIALVAALRETSVLFAAVDRGGRPEGAAARRAHHRGGDDRRAGWC